MTHRFMEPPPESNSKRRDKGVYKNTEKIFFFLGNLSKTIEVILTSETTKTTDCYRFTYDEESMGSWKIDPCTADPFHNQLQPFEIYIYICIQ